VDVLIGFYWKYLYTKYLALSQIISEAYRSNLLELLRTYGAKNSCIDNIQLILKKSVILTWEGKK